MEHLKRKPPFHGLFIVPLIITSEKNSFFMDFDLDLQATLFNFAKQNIETVLRGPYTAH